jgi:hypothetical protein
MSDGDVAMFLKHVDLVTSEIDNLLKSDTSSLPNCSESESFLKKQATIKKIREEEEISRKENLQKFGQSGNGVKSDFLFFCKGCFTEYFTEITQCNRCGSTNLLTKAQRMEELQIKVEEIKRQDGLKKLKKDKLEKYLKSKDLVVRR